MLFRSVSEEKSSNEGLPFSLKNGKAKVSVKEIRDLARRAKVGNKGSIDGDVTATMLDTGEVFLEVKVDSPRTPVVRVLRSAQIPPRVRTSVKKIEKVRWRNEVLEHVAKSYPSSARALARQALDSTYVVTSEDLKPAQAMIDSRADCADFEAVGLVHVLHRFPESQWEKV